MIQHNADYSVVSIAAAGIAIQTTVKATLTDVPNNNARILFRIT